MEMRRIDELKAHPTNEEIYINADVSDLVYSISSQGFFEENPLVIDDMGVIVSGHRRWMACKELGIEEVPVMYREFPDDYEKIEFLLNSNKQRNKSVGEKTREGIAYEYVEKGRALNRMSMGGKGGIEEGEANLPHLDRLPQSRDFASEKVGMKSRSYDDAKKVINRLRGKHETGRDLKEADIKFGGYIYTVPYSEDEVEFYERILSGSVSGALRAIRGDLYNEISDYVYGEFMDGAITLTATEAGASRDYQKHIEKRAKVETKAEEQEDIRERHDEQTGRDYEERKENFKDTEVAHQYDDHDEVPPEDDDAPLPTDEQVEEHIEATSIARSVGGEGKTTDYYLKNFKEIESKMDVIYNRMIIAFKGYDMVPLNSRIELMNKFDVIYDYAEDFFAVDRPLDTPPEDDYSYEEE